MNRREFVLKSGRWTGAIAMGGACGADLWAAADKTGRSGLAWQCDTATKLFTGVSADGKPLAARNDAGLLDGFCRLSVGGSGEAVRLGVRQSRSRLGPLHLELHHRLLAGAGAGEDLLEATLSVRNEGDRPQQVEACFLIGAQPGPETSGQRVYVPLSAAGGSRDQRFAALGVDDFLEDCEQPADTGGFVCHYLEPMASFPAERTTRALLLAPVVDVFRPSHPWRVAFFTSSDQPARFRLTGEHGAGAAWEAGRTMTIPADKTMTSRCWLHVHRGDASVSWRAFQRFGHREDHPPIPWTREFKVHYYDFLSSAQGNNGRRGDGYEYDLPFFRDFRVGLATQHGYYPHLGDYIRPERKAWPAMPGDKQGSAEMSFDKMRSRILATREAGAKAAVYLHPVLFDDAAPNFHELCGSVLVDEKGTRVPFPWEGPDTQGRNWRASLASARWREHLLRQAQWVMEILSPDAIVVDETFAGLGYDYHPGRAGPMSAGAIDFYRKLRTLVRSFGADRAVFASDCSLAPFVYWFDGECGDHAYPSLLGRPSYMQEPVRFLAALGDKPWRPCSWHFQHTWDDQMKLARKVGAGVGVSNGWIEFTGLHGLPEAAKARILADIAALHP
jgi:hypothetical protein